MRRSVRKTRRAEVVDLEATSEGTSTDEREEIEKIESEEIDNGFVVKDEEATDSDYEPSSISRDTEDTTVIENSTQQLEILSRLTVIESTVKACFDTCQQILSSLQASQSD